VERQIAEEDAEHEASRTAMIKERDHLKHALKEREEASSELRKQVASLDRANRAAQSKKAKRRCCNRRERRKMKQDTQMGQRYRRDGQRRSRDAEGETRNRRSEEEDWRFGGILVKARSQ
jgi:hypothetical protein